LDPACFRSVGEQNTKQREFGYAFEQLGTDFVNGAENAAAY